MKQQRLLWLVGVMCVLVILRVVAPSPDSDRPPAVAEAIVRKAPATKATLAPTTPASPTASAMAFEPAPPVNDLEVPGNAFAVRPPPPTPYVPPAPVVAKAVPVAPIPVATPVAMEPAAPPMPYQVIGTWDDGKEPGVFLSSPNGTLLARTGATLQSEYKVTAITPQQISLQHLASKREVRLALPRPAPTSFTLPPRPYP